jgi:aminopeptidase N
LDDLLSELIPFNDNELIKVGAGERALYASLLKLNTFLDGGKLAYERFNEAKNMTDIQAAFIPLMSTKFRPQAIRQFYKDWKTDRLVIDKWFA